jgi:hypothetical protein
VVAEHHWQHIDVESAAGWYVRSFSLYVFVIAGFVLLASCEAIAMSVKKMDVPRCTVPSGPSLPAWFVVASSWPCLKKGRDVC